jgi:prepilin-type N-terminal cleavage/methylation domain-containing protein
MKQFDWRNIRPQLTSPRMSARTQPELTLPPPCRAGRAAFTLVELLVVMAIIALLAGLLLPALARAKERAKAAKVHAELYGVGLALEMYADDHAGQLPPVRVNCNTDLYSHWCQFPVELAEQGYLPKSDQPGRAANLEDVFNPGHTYKYAAPGPQILNDTPEGNFKVWVPDDLPHFASATGKWWSMPKESPVRWVVWSLGPRPDSKKSQDGHAPLTAASWYRRAGDSGVLARFATRDGMQWKTP